jgi:hypothetical protein
MGLMRKHGRIRTTPTPNWVKIAIDAWASGANVSEGMSSGP